MTSFCQFWVYQVPKGVFCTEIQISLRLAWQRRFIYSINKNSNSHTALVCGYGDFMQTSRKAVVKVLRISGFITCLPSLPQHDPWTYRPGQPAPRTGLPEERRGSLHSFRQMDKSAEHTQPSDCEQAHMMVHKTKRQIGMFEYIYVHFE